MRAYATFFAVLSLIAFVLSHTSLDGLKAEEIEKMTLTPEIVEASTPLTNSSSKDHPCYVLSRKPLPKNDKALADAIVKLCPNVDFPRGAGNFLVAGGALAVTAVIFIALF